MRRNSESGILPTFRPENFEQDRLEHDHKKEASLAQGEIQIHGYAHKRPRASLTRSLAHTRGLALEDLKQPEDLPRVGGGEGVGVDEAAKLLDPVEKVAGKQPLGQQQRALVVVHARPEIKHCTRSWRRGKRAAGG